jgi:hypothetical protein
MSISDIAVGVSAELKDLLAQRRANELEAQARTERDRTRQDMLDRQAVDDDYRERQAAMNEATHALTIEGGKRDRMVDLFRVAQDSGTTLTPEQHEQIMEHAPELAPALTEIGEYGVMAPGVGQGPTFDVTGYKPLPPREWRMEEERRGRLADMAAEQYGDSPQVRALIEAGGTLQDVQTMLGLSASLIEQRRLERQEQAVAGFASFKAQKEWEWLNDPSTIWEAQKNYATMWESEGVHLHGQDWNKPPTDAVTGKARVRTPEEQTALDRMNAAVQAATDKRYAVMYGGGAEAPQQSPALDGESARMDRNLKAELTQARRAHSRTNPMSERQFTQAVERILRPYAEGPNYNEGEYRSMVAEMRQNFVGAGVMAESPREREEQVPAQILQESVAPPYFGSPAMMAKPLMSDNAWRQMYPEVAAQEDEYKASVRQQQAQRKARALNQGQLGYETGPPPTTTAPGSFFRIPR